jgi:cytochrome oxidase Cu insertion factor (SCO1/SenC/PrrC family)
VRDIDKSNYKLLTGSREDINALMKKLQVIAIPGDTTKTSEGDPVYFFTHTDRAFLVDKDNKIRSEYRASKLNVSEVVEDIRSLE